MTSGSRSRTRTRSRRSKSGGRKQSHGFSREGGEMKIAVLAGDGIGPEIVAQATKVLRALASDGLKLELEEAPFGGAGVDAHGDPLPASTLNLAKAADAVVCGAVGGPRYDALPRPQRPEQGILRIRKELRLFASQRSEERRVVK